MGDPATFDDYNIKFLRNMEFSGRGADTVTHMPCPACAAPKWLKFPVTAAMDNYAEVQKPSSCEECGRTFRMVITIEDGGACLGGSTKSTIVQLDGPDIPDYLPPMLREGGA